MMNIKCCGVCEMWDIKRDAVYFSAWTDTNKLIGVCETCYRAGFKILGKLDGGSFNCREIPTYTIHSTKGVDAHYIHSAETLDAMIRLFIRNSMAIEAITENCDGDIKVITGDDLSFYVLSAFDLN